MVKCLVMFSGGLDSTIAVHLMQQQDLEVTALHFVLPFKSGLGRDHSRIRAAADNLGVPLIVVEEGEEFLAMARAPDFGYGKNANPCLDCRIHRLRRAASMMAELGASFIVTGEVVGQRPMSQRRDSMHTVINRTGLKGLLLRPLSAHLLEPTIPETRGWVDRTRLLGIGGRGRKEQLAYARRFGLRFESPGGGCLLTMEQTARRFHDLRQCLPDFTLLDYQLLGYGRHFRLSPDLRLIVARDDRENGVLEKLRAADDCMLSVMDTTGPLGLLRGEAPAAHMERAAALLTRYCRLRAAPQVRVCAERYGQSTVVTVTPADDAACEAVRI